MQGIHVAIGVMLVVATVATVLGYQATPTDAADGQVVFAITRIETTAPPATIPPSGATVTMATPDNATAGTLGITLSWAGSQPVPSTATASVRIEWPDGNTSEETLTWSYTPTGPATYSASFGLPGWAAVPESFEGTLADADAFAIAWPALNVTLARTDAPTPGVGYPSALVATLTFLTSAYAAESVPADEPTGGP